MLVPTASLSFWKSPVQWVKKNLFDSALNTAITLVCLFVLGKFLYPLLNWFVLDSTWNSTPEVCRSRQGACWSFIQEKFRLILFGLYPYSEQWRPALILVVFVILLGISQQRRFWKRSLFYLWGVCLLMAILLIKGGILGLPEVDRELIGGLPLTLGLSVIGIIVSYPLGIFLCLGRRSQMPIIKSLSIGYIELIRGVPLVSLLFMSSVMFPLFLPEGMSIDKIVRAQVAIILFSAAYMAEVVRGGLQAIPKGQYEAAESLGLSYSQSMRQVILPQALKIVIPSTVSTSISLFKDTSLVVIISLFDLLYTMKLSQKDLQWHGFENEAYVFVALIYFAFCLSLSRFGQKLERELDTREKGSRK